MNFLNSREKLIEQKLVKAVKARGGISPKFISPGFVGMPDRLVLMPEGKLFFSILIWWLLMSCLLLSPGQQSGLKVC